MSNDSQEVIFQVQDLHRSFGPKEVLRGVTLGFFRGAKIGLIGVNGSGKSTLLKIIAGADSGYEGSVTIAKGATIGHVPQEPTLDTSKTVRENVEEGAVAEVKKFSNMGLNKELSANKIIGIKEIKDYIMGKTTLIKTKELIKLKTRQYAKSQFTWARGHMKSWESIYSPNFDDLFRQAINKIS